MSIIIHFTPASTLISSNTVSSVSTCAIDTENSLNMGPALETDSSLSVMSPDDSSMVDVSTSELYTGKDKEHVSYHSSLGSCFGLPYQDHNYGAPPPPTPPSHSPQMSPVHVANAIVEAEPISSESIAVSHSEEVSETSITRCVCGFDHDDEYMICCDRCLVWQHVDCMGLDRNRIPETYLCEKCEPRKIDRQKAKLLQAKKKVALTGKYIYKDTSEESEDDRRERFPNLESHPKTRSKSSRKKSEDDSKNEPNVKKGRANAKHGKERMEIKRSKFRRKAKNKSEGAVLGDEEAQDAWKCSDKRKDENSESSSETHNLGATLRSQTDEMRLSKLQDQLCKLVEFSNNQKKLVASTDLPKDQIIIEYKGQFLSATQFHQKNPVFSQKQFPFILFYKLRSHEELCVDAAENGNDARFVRRSCTPNAEIRHLVSNGSLHLYISSIKNIHKEEEITIPFDMNFKDCLHEVECACNTDSCFISKQKNVRSESSERRKRSKRQPQSTDDDSNHSLADSLILSPTKSIKSSPIKTNSPIKPTTPVPNSLGESSDTSIIPEEHLTEEQIKEQRKKMTREERKLDAIMRAFDQMEKAAKRKQQALERQTKTQQPKTEPKVEESNDKHEKQETPSNPSLKDEEKHITTENSSSVDDEKSVVQPSKPKKGKRRRGSGTSVRRRTRTNSGGSDVFIADDNATACDTVITPSTPSIEAIETPETEILASSPPPAQAQGALPALPKTKRFLHNEWLQEKESIVPVSSPLTLMTETANLVLSPPKCYIRCTKNNPPGSGISAAHLRRSSFAGIGRSASSQGSAKKRWLRQAMFEPIDSSISMEVVNGEVSSPSHPICFSPVGSDVSGILSIDEVVTPLKKRRILRKSVESVSSSEWMGASSELSPDNSSCDSTMDSSTETTVELIKTESMKEEKTPTPGSNGLGRHLLKTLRENWIKNENKLKIPDVEEKSQIIENMGMHLLSEQSEAKVNTSDSEMCNVKNVVNKENDLRMEIDCNVSSADTIVSSNISSNDTDMECVQENIHPLLTASKNCTDIDALKKEIIDDTHTKNENLAKLISNKVTSQDMENIIKQQNNVENDIIIKNEDMRKNEIEDTIEKYKDKGIVMVSNKKIEDDVILKPEKRIDEILKNIVEDNVKNENTYAKNDEQDYAKNKLNYAKNKLENYAKNKLEDYAKNKLEDYAKNKLEDYAKNELDNYEKDDFKSDAKDDFKSDAKDDLKSNAKDDLKSDAKNDLKSDAKNDLKSDAKDDLKSDAKDYLKRDAKDDLKCDAQDDLKSYARNELKDIENNKIKDNLIMENEEKESVVMNKEKDDLIDKSEKQINVINEDNNKTLHNNDINDNKQSKEEIEIFLHKANNNTLMQIEDSTKTVSNFSSHTIVSEISNSILANSEEKSCNTNSAISIEIPIVPQPPKRKVSLSEYRQRRKENPSVKANSDKKKTNNCVLNASGSLEDLSERDIQLAALPLFKSFMNKTEQNGTNTIKSLKIEEEKKYVIKRPRAKPRENLTERLKREFGLDDVETDFYKEPKPLESILKPRVSSSSSPPPPPPPPRTTQDKIPFTYPPPQSYLPQITSNQCTAASSIMSSVHGISSYTTMPRPYHHTYSPVMVQPPTSIQTTYPFKTYK